MKTVRAKYADFDIEFLRDFIDNAAIGIHSFNNDGVLIYVNKAQLNLLGYQEYEYLQLSIYDLHTERTILDDMFCRLRNGENIYDLPAKLIAKDGSVRDVIINSSPYCDDDSLVYTRCFIRDITDFKKAKRALKDSETNFRFMADIMPQQVWTATPDGVLDYVNQRIINNFDASAEEVIGQGWIKFLHPDDVKECLKRWFTSLQTGEPYQIEFRLNITGEGYKWHLGRALPLVTDGKIVKWFGTNTDIDEQKRNEEKKDEFISIASHELKTPLTTVKAFIQLAARNTASAEQVSAFLDKADQQVGNLQRLIEDLLDTSKISAGKVSYDFTDFNFVELLNKSIESLRHHAPNHELILENDADVIYQGDKFRIEQVINNFVSNAVKYSPNADKVIIRANIQDENIVVSVQDFGIGIAPEHVTRLFDRFYRVDNTAMKYQGLGLGLYISSEILKRHGGSFWIESKPGKGSTFYFLLPLKAKATTEVETDNQTYYRTSFIQMEYNAELQQLEVDWTGFQNVESVKAGGRIMLDLLKKNKCSKVLNDNTHVKGNWSEASDWAGKTWFPMMEQGGLRYFAWVFSPSTFSSLAAKKSVDVMMGKVQTQFFNNRNEAGEWLQQLP